MPTQESATGVLLRRRFCFALCKDEMSEKMSGAESVGAKSRDHTHPRHHFWKHAHRDWRVWIAVMLMLVAIGIYVMTDGLSLRPGKRAIQPTPEINAP